MRNFWHRSAFALLLLSAHGAKAADAPFYLAEVGVGLQPEQGSVLALSDSGAAIGTYTTPDTVIHFFADDGVQLSTLGATPPVNYPELDALEVNASNQIVGNFSGQTPTGWANYGFVVTGGAFTPLVYSADSTSYISQISANGRIAGTNYTSDGGNGTSFLWQNSLFTTLPANGRVSSTVDMNASGTTIGNVGSSDKHNHACLWKNGKFKDLNPPGAEKSFAEKINRSGLVLGWFQRKGESPHAFTWKDNTFKDLGTLPGDVFFFLSDSGHIALYLGNDGKGKEPAAFVYENGAFQEIKIVGSVQVAGIFLSETGRIAGSYYSASQYTHAFTWANGKVTKLEPAGSLYSTVVGINDAGEIAGTYARQADSSSKAFVWRDATFTTLPVSGKYIQAIALNQAGQIAVSSASDDGTPTRYFLASPSYPTFLLSGGAKSRVTKSSSLLISGSVVGRVTLVDYRIGSSKIFRTAVGTNSWHFTARLKKGTNRITIRAHGPTQTAAPLKLIIKRT